MICDAVVRIHATKDIAIITVMSDAIFARFNVLWDLPRNGHLTRSQYHGSPRPFKSRKVYISVELEKNIFGEKETAEQMQYL